MLLDHGAPHPAARNHQRHHARNDRTRNRSAACRLLGDHRPQRSKRCRPRRRPHAMRCRIDGSQMIRLERRHEVDGASDFRIPRRRGPFVISLQQVIRRRIRHRQLKRDEHARQLVIELVAEMMRGELESRAHALPFGVGEIADPTVLHVAEDDERHGEDRQRDERCCGAAAPLHAIESSIRICAKSERPCGFYLSYKALSSG